MARTASPVCTVADGPRAAFCWRSPPTISPVFSTMAGSTRPAGVGRTASPASGAAAATANRLLRFSSAERRDRLLPPSGGSIRELIFAEESRRVIEDSSSPGFAPRSSRVGGTGGAPKYGSNRTSEGRGRSRKCVRLRGLAGRPEHAAGRARLADLAERRPLAGAVVVQVGQQVGDAALVELRHPVQDLQRRRVAGGAGPRLPVGEVLEGLRILRPAPVPPLGGLRLGPAAGLPQRDARVDVEAPLELPADLGPGVVGGPQLVGQLGLDLLQAPGFPAHGSAIPCLGGRPVPSGPVTLRASRTVECGAPPLPSRDRDLFLPASPGENVG